MAKGPQILTANRLTDGMVLYWTGAGWAEPMARAEIFEDAARAKQALERAGKWVGDRIVVNPYLFEIKLEDSVAVPVKEREKVRAAGPTVRRDLGKQANAATVPQFRIDPAPAPSPPVEAEGPEAFDVSV